MRSVGRSLSVTQSVSHCQSVTFGLNFVCCFVFPEERKEGRKEGRWSLTSLTHRPTYHCHCHCHCQFVRSFTVLCCVVVCVVVLLCCSVCRVCRVVVLCCSLCLCFVVVLWKVKANFAECSLACLFATTAPLHAPPPPHPPTTTTAD